jgi:hypothetical protein
MGAAPFNWQRRLRADGGWLLVELWNPMAAAWEAVPGNDRFPVADAAAASAYVEAENAQQQATNAR